jgi:ABC-type lipoprotein release transport system permease subunit
MVVTAVTSLIFLSALAVGVNDAMVRNSVSLYSGHISGFALPSTLKAENLYVEGVTAVLKRISIPVIISYRGHLETVTLVGINPVEESKMTAIWKKIIAGNYIRTGERSILLSQQLAQRLNAKPDAVISFRSEFEKNKRLLKVSGIYIHGDCNRAGIRCGLFGNCLCVCYIYP